MRLSRICRTRWSGSRRKAKTPSRRKSRKRLKPCRRSGATGRTRISNGRKRRSRRRATSSPGRTRRQESSDERACPLPNGCSTDGAGVVRRRSQPASAPGINRRHADDCGAGRGDAAWRRQTVSLPDLVTVIVLAAQTTLEMARDWFFGRFLANFDIVVILTALRMWSQSEHRRTAEALRVARKELAEAVANTAATNAASSSAQNAEILLEVQANTD